MCDIVKSGDDPYRAQRFVPDIAANIQEAISVRVDPGSSIFTIPDRDQLFEISQYDGLSIDGLARQMHVFRVRRLL